MPRLKTRRISSSSTWRASQREHRRALPRVPVDLGAAACGEDALEVAGDAAAGDVRERARAAAEPADDVEVEARRREQVRAVVVLLLEHAPDEREAVRVDAGRREADHDVAGLDRGAVERLVDDADARAGEVELAVAVDARELGRLAADERDARLTADLRRAFDELRHLARARPAPRRRSRAGRAVRRRT